MTFGGNTRVLGSFGEATDKITTLHQSRRRIAGQWLETASQILVTASGYIRIILELLKKEKLYAKFSKCDFWIHIVQFLGHLINSQGLHVDPARFNQLRLDISLLQNTTEIRQYLDLTAIIRRFIKDFSKIAKSLTELTQKNKKYIWGENQEFSFPTAKIEAM
ncbi:hypothetical protein Tco_1376084 [Tanacetum coccineum]